VEIKGYKAFNKDHTNRYGVPFEEGKSYHADGPIRFGNNGCGFHMCVHLSDVFRFFDPKNVDVAAVTASGTFDEGEYDDWQEPYYDMYAVSDIHIDKFLSREEILEIMMNASASDIVKFMATFDITDEEALMLLRANRYKDCLEKLKKAYLYYLKGINVYFMEKEDCERVLRKVLVDGQDSNQRSKGK